MLRRLAVLLAWGASTATLVTVLNACGGDEPDGTPNRATEGASGPSGKRKPCPPDGSKAVNFSAYWLGDSFQEIPLERTLRECTDPKPGRPRINYVSFIYGDCVATSDSGCAPPFEIRSDPACETNLSRYRRGSYQLLRVRGVPAATFGAGAQIEIYTGDATVAIFGPSNARVMEAADAMRSIPGNQDAVQPGRDLPKTAPGALQGKLRC
jgi:hypothetical protein